MKQKPRPPISQHEQKRNSMQALQRQAQEQIDKERSRRTPIYIGDVEGMLQRVASHVPMIDSEAVFLAELETQNKFFLAFSIMGALMFLLGIMI